MEGPSLEASHSWLLGQIVWPLHFSGGAHLLSALRSLDLHTTDSNANLFAKLKCALIFLCGDQQ